MQKVEGSNPFSRFRKGMRLQVFFVSVVGWCVSATGLRMGTRGRTSGGSVLEQRLQAVPYDSNH